MRIKKIAIDRGYRIAGFPELTDGFQQRIIVCNPNFKSRISGIKVDHIYILRGME